MLALGYVRSCDFWTDLLGDNGGIVTSRCLGGRRDITVVLGGVDLIYRGGRYSRFSLRVPYRLRFVVLRRCRGVLLCARRFTPGGIQSCGPLRGHVLGRPHGQGVEHRGLLVPEDVPGELYVMMMVKNGEPSTVASLSVGCLGIAG